MTGDARVCRDTNNHSDINGLRGVIDGHMFLPSGNFREVFVLAVDNRSLPLRVATDGRPSKLRSWLTNNPRRLSSDVDRRSAEQRRFGDLYDALVIELPGADPVRLREIALLRFEHERGQAAGTVSLEDSVRVHNLIARLTREIRNAARQRSVKTPSSPLLDHFSRPPEPR